MVAMSVRCLFHVRIASHELLSFNKISFNILIFNFSHGYLAISVTDLSW
jgi:hypothetical protein